MKSVLEKWRGTYEINEEEVKDLDNFFPEDGDEFHIKLIPSVIYKFHEKGENDDKTGTVVQ